MNNTVTALIATLAFCAVVILAYIYRDWLGQASHTVPDCRHLYSVTRLDDRRLSVRCTYCRHELRRFFS